MSALREQFFKNWEEHGPRDEARKSAQRPPEGVAAVRNVSYRDPVALDTLMDIFFPVHFEGILPAIVDVHGGGWVYGNKELNEYYCMELAKMGFVVFDINYRLAPKIDLKGQVQDVAAALNWVFRHAQEYQADREKLYLTGDSAGAQLALLTCGAASNEEYRKLYEIPELEGMIRGLGLTCPVTCLHEMSRSEDGMQREWMGVVYGVKETGESIQVGGGPQFDTLEDQLPIWNYSDPKDYLRECVIPPLYILTTTGDNNYHWQSERLHQLLLKNEKEHVYRVWEPGGDEELHHVFNVLYPQYEDSRKANQEMTEFFLSK